MEGFAWYNASLEDWENFILFDFIFVQKIGKMFLYQIAGYDM